MQRIITDKTVMSDIRGAILADSSIVSQLLDKAGCDDFDIFTISVGDFVKLADNKVFDVFPWMAEPDCTVIRFYQRVNSVKKGMEGFSNLMKNYHIPVKHNTGVEFSLEESMLISLTKYYHLHSLADAQALTLYEYVIMVKDQYNEYRANKMEADEMNRKTKTKR